MRLTLTKNDNILQSCQKLRKDKQPYNKGLVPRKVTGEKGTSVLRSQHPNRD